jgi:hypothetical protein
MSIAAFAGGVQEELAKIIKERILAEQQEFENQRTLNAEGLNERKFGEGVRQFDAGHALDTERVGIDRGALDLNRDRFGLEQTQWTEGAPQREATLDQTVAQTGEIRRKPVAEQQNREHDVNLANIGGQWGLRTIGAQGAEQRKTATHTAGLKNAAEGPSAYAQERNRRTVDSVDELIGKVSNWTAGWGSTLANAPATDARDFKAALDTLKANVAFNELTQMREASKTGGALGSVAVRELQLLEATLGALDQAQSPDALRQQLGKVKESVQRWEQVKSGGQATTGRASGAGPGSAANATKSRFTIQSVK